MSDRVHTTRLAVALAAVLAALAAAAPAMADGIGMQCTDGSLAANTRTFDLTARQGTMETPDGNSNLMWSYAVTGGEFQTPGPVLCANEGEVVRVNLHNALADPTSIVFPGQKNVSATGSAGLFTKEAPAGADATYEFTATRPGTFVYESGTDPAKQIEMGLASALIVRPDGHPTWAYNSSRTAFNPDREYLLMLSEADPELHSAVENGEPYDILSLHNRYYTVNGRSFPDTLQDNDVPWLPTQPYGSLVRIKPFDADLNPLPALIRIVNVGVDNHPYHPHGQSLRQVANDGNLLLTSSGDDAATERFGETVPSGSTEDYLLSYTDQDNFSPSNPAPGVASIPSYLNLNFKDGNTWYSGAPYLGTVGKLPAGTTSQNYCGAFYFPWHSHALNEFANFEAAFGGMATMLRVDPLVGCSTPGMETYADAPNGASVTTGAVSSGSIAGLEDAGGSRFAVRSNLTGVRTVAWYGTFTDIPTPTVDNPAGVLNLQVAYTGRNRRLTGTVPQISCTQVVRIWKWTTSTWVTLDSRTVGFSDVALTDLAAPGTNDSQYVSPSGDVRVGVTCTGAVPGSTTFTSSGDLMQITYDAP